MGSKVTRKSLDVLLETLDDSVYIADIFLLLHLDEVQQPIATNIEDLRLQVPACIDELFKKETYESNEVLKALVTWARPDVRYWRSLALDTLVDDIRAKYAALRKNGFLKAIADESDPAVATALARALPSTKQKRGVIFRMKETVKKSVTTILSYSKRTGRAILMRGRQLADLVRDWLVSLELPSRADQVVKKKASFAARTFAFKGGQATKFHRH